MYLEVNDSDKSFGVLFHHNPEPMWIVEVDTLQFKDVNQAAIQHYGYSREEFLNQITLANIRLPQEQKEMLSLIKKIKHNETIKRDVTHLKKDGSTIYVNFTSFNVKYNNSLCRMVIIHDITGQKLKDIELTLAVNKMHETLESITDGFITMNGKLKVTYWNKEAESMLLIKRENILEKTLWQLQPYYRKLALYKQLHNALKNKETLKTEEYVSFVNRWIRFIIYPGKEGLTIYFRDITSQKHGEEQIRLKNQSLDRIAFLNSHTIRKPLANILGIINSLEGLPYEDHFEQPLKMLKQSAIELDEIINDINNDIERTMQ